MQPRSARDPPSPQSRSAPLPLSGDRDVIARLCLPTHRISLFGSLTRAWQHLKCRLAGAVVFGEYTASPPTRLRPPQFVVATCAKWCGLPLRAPLRASASFSSAMLIR